MKLAIALCITLWALSACSDAPVGTQREAWFNTCGVEQYLKADVADGECGEWVLWGCKDGDQQVMYLDALGRSWIGAQCYSDPERTFYYECGVVDGRAQVYCKDR